MPPAWGPCHAGEKEGMHSLAAGGLVDPRPGVGEFQCARTTESRTLRGFTTRANTDQAS
jgi:hypothetical protein